MAKSAAGGTLHDQLSRWTSAGLIDADQASRIEAAERVRTESQPRLPKRPAAGLLTATRPAASPGKSVSGPAGSGTTGSGPIGSGQPATDQPHRRLPLFVESLGYLGAVIAVAAGAIVVHHFWPSMPTSAELALAGVVAVVLLVVGAVLHIGAEPAFGRLRSVLWLISTVAVTAFAAVLADRIWRLSGISVALLAEGTGTSYAIVLWWRNRSTLQHLAMFAGTAALAATAVHQAGSGTAAWGPGLVIWLVSALWGIAVHRGYLAPRTAGLVAAGFGLLLGAQLTMLDTAAGQVLAIGTVAGLLAAGIALHRVLLLGLGAAGAIVILPQTASRYLPSSAAAALSVCAIGLILLGIALWLAKSRKAA